MTIMIPEFWTVAQAAPVLCVDKDTLYRALQQNNGRFNGVLLAIRVGHQWRFMPEVMARIARGEQPYLYE